MHTALLGRRDGTIQHSFKRYRCVPLTSTSFIWLTWLFFGGVCKFGSSLLHPAPRSLHFVMWKANLIIHRFVMLLDVESKSNYTVCWASTMMNLHTEHNPSFTDIKPGGRRPAQHRTAALYIACNSYRPGSRPNKCLTIKIASRFSYFHQKS